MPRVRISPFQKEIIALAIERGWIVAEFVYRDVLGLKRVGKDREPVSSSIRASVSRSISRLVGRGILRRTSTGCFELTEPRTP
jgi:hypothetical protein